MGSGKPTYKRVGLTNNRQVSQMRPPLAACEPAGCYNKLLDVLYVFDSVWNSVKKVVGPDVFNLKS